MVGAFVEEELRAEQEVVLANGRSYATLNVNLTGKERVIFRIREAASGKEYRWPGCWSWDWERRMAELKS